MVPISRRKHNGDGTFEPCPHSLIRRHSSPFPDCLDTRAILRRLDRMIGFPEETALLLRDFELDSFSGKGGVSAATLICGGGVATNIRSIDKGNL